MLRYEDECAGCPPELGCMGDACEYKNVPHWYCDECGEEFKPEELRQLDGKELCQECFCEEAWNSARKVRRD